MKFLSSSSSSASSTATTSDSNYYIHRNANSVGLIGMLRRLLCFNNSLPTHQFDHITDFTNEAKRCRELNYGQHEEIKFEVTGNPGIVARLMGLDSMPEVDCNGNQTKSASITRSQSMNYADIGREELVQAKHCKIKSTLSFREAPTFVEMETEEFFILSFEGDGKDNELLLKTRKSDTGFRELKPRREKGRNKNRKSENGYDNNKENLAPSDVNGSKVQDSSKILRPTSKLSQNSDVIVEVMKQPKPICQRQSGKRRRSKRKKKENCSPVQKVELQNDSENSSPISVFDYGDSLPEPEVPHSGEDLRLADSSSRRKLSGELDIYNHSSSIITSNLTSNDEKAEKSEAKCPHSWKNSDRGFQNYAEMWEELCKLTKRETMESDRKYQEPRQLEDFKDIGAEIGLEILDHLISEFLELSTSKQDIIDCNTAQDKHIFHIPAV